MRRVAIIGAGPAGLTAAIQLKRLGLAPLVFEKREVGGLLVNAQRVENYPGFPGGIAGEKLVDLFRRQFAKCHIDVCPAEVTRLSWADDGFEIDYPGGQMRAERVIVASGTRAQEPTGFVISPEAQAHVFFEVALLPPLRNGRIVIVGAGDAACDYALRLAAKNDVFILGRGRKAKALALLQDRVRNHPRIDYQPETRVERIDFAPPSAVLVQARRAGRMESFRGSHVLLALGRVPENGFFSPGLDAAWQKSGDKKVLFLAGDVQNGDCRQVAIAVGDGMRAAMEIGRCSRKVDG